jgi:hypothetical protein
MTTETMPMPTTPTISRTYRGKQGMKDFHEDSTRLAGYGYTIASQVETQGGRTAAATLFIVLGVVFLVAGLVFLPSLLAAVVCLVIGLASGKAPAELAVVWTHAKP